MDRSNYIPFTDETFPALNTVELMESSGLRFAIVAAGKHLIGKSGSVCGVRIAFAGACEERTFESLLNDGYSLRINGTYWQPCGLLKPASAVETDTAADVKEEDRWYMSKGGNAIWVFPQRLVYSASLPFGVQSDSTEADMTNDLVATRVMVSTARARIDAWQAAKQTKPAPSSAQAPERVMVNISPANGNAVAAWSPHELAPEGIVLHPYVRGDIAEGLNGKLALANARIAELEKWNETLLEKLAEYRKRVGAAHALD